MGKSPLMGCYQIWDEHPVAFYGFIIILRYYWSEEVRDMSYTMIVRPNYDTVVGAVDAGEDGPEGEAKRTLLNHLLLQRYGMDVNGRLGINSSRGKLAQLYIEKMRAEKKSEEEKAREAVKQVDALILTFNKTLDRLRLPNQTAKAR